MLLSQHYYRIKWTRQVTSSQTLLTKIRDFSKEYNIQCWEFLRAIFRAFTNLSWFTCSVVTVRSEMSPKHWQIHEAKFI